MKKITQNATLKSYEQMLTHQVDSCNRLKTKLAARYLAAL